jgi:hypothetical protein
MHQVRWNWNQGRECLTGRIGVHPVGVGTAVVSRTVSSRAVSCTAVRCLIARSDVTVGGVSGSLRHRRSGLRQRNREAHRDYLA